MFQFLMDSSEQKLFDRLSNITRNWFIFWVIKYVKQTQTTPIYLKKNVFSHERQGRGGSHPRAQSAWLDTLSAVWECLPKAQIRCRGKE